MRVRPVLSQLAAVMLLCGISLARFGTAQAADVAVVRQPCEEPLVQGYEPITLGYAWQSNDEPFIDFTLSFKAPLLRDLFCRHFDGRGQLYLTFTGRFAFYVGKRPSSPVIAREYNPKLLWRWVDLGKTTTSTGYDKKPVSEYAQYVDFAYAHSSDGQTIDTLEEYEIQSEQSRSARDALDYISRGWDYLQVAGKMTALDALGHGGDLSIYPDFKFFLRHGLLQGVPEEYHSWEHDTSLRPRHAFDGIAVTLEYRPFAQQIDRVAQRAETKETLRFALKYLTGYDPVARYNTVRGEFGYAPWGLPVTFWAQDGYMSSLARYYKKTRAAGIELRFAEF